MAIIKLDMPRGIRRGMKSGNCFLAIAVSIAYVGAATLGCSSAKLDIEKDDGNVQKKNIMGFQEFIVHCSGNEAKKTAVISRAKTFFIGSVIEKDKDGVDDVVVNISNINKKVEDFSQCFLQQGKFSLVEVYCCNGHPKECVSEAEKSGKWKQIRQMELADRGGVSEYICDAVYAGESFVLSNDDVADVLTWEGNVINSGASAVLTLNLTDLGERKLQESTRRNVGQYLAFVVDGVVLECVKVETELKNAAVVAKIFGRDMREAMGKAGCLAAAIENGPLNKYGEGACEIEKH